MSIHRMPIASITYQDVEDFLNQKIPECLHVDYKKECPSDIAKDVAAMANAIGGVILIGVTTIGEDEGKPGVPDKAIGLDDCENVQRRIEKKCADVLYPPIVPDMCRIYLNGESGPQILLLRIPASPSAPHWIGEGDGSQLPIRVSDFTAKRRHVRFIKPQELEGYAQGRNILKERRVNLLRRARSRCMHSEQIRSTYDIPAFNLRNPASYNEFFVGLVEFFICPTFPSSLRYDHGELKGLLDKFREQLGIPAKCGQTAYETAIVHGKAKPDTYLELTTWGSLFLSQELRGTDRRMNLNGDEIIRSLGTFLAYTSFCLEQSEFSTLLTLNLRVHKALPDFTLGLPPGGDNNYSYASTPDREFDIEEVIYTNELMSKSQLKPLIEKLVFAIGLGNMDYAGVITNSAVERLEKIFKITLTGLKEPLR